MPLQTEPFAERTAEVQREYFATYGLLDPQAVEAVELLEAGISFSRVIALYPLDLGQLTHWFVSFVQEEAAIAPFIKSMKHSGLGLIEHYGSNELLDEFFLMPEKLDFSFPEIQRLADDSYPTHDTQTTMAFSPLELALCALADALWLGSNWKRLAPGENEMVGSQLVKVLRSYREALQALDSSQFAAVS